MWFIRLPGHHGRAQSPLVVPSPSWRGLGRSLVGFQTAETQVFTSNLALPGELKDPAVEGDNYRKLPEITVKSKNSGLASLL